MTAAEYSQVCAPFIRSIKVCTMELTLMLVNCIIIIVNLAASTSSHFEEKGAGGQTLPKAATFHFPEYAYKETSKNV